MSVTNNVPANASAAAGDQVVFKKQNQAKEVWRRFKKSKSAMIGLVIILALILLAVCADLIIPYKAAITQNLREKLQPPSSHHLFGTDGYGRDLFARCVHGGRVSLSIGFATTIGSTFFGLLLGSLAGFYGGSIESVIMRLMDIISSMPSILLALTVVAALGSSIFNLILAILISRVPAMVRVVRSAILTVVDQEYVEAARAGGTKDSRIISKHILPNALGPIMVQATMSVSQMMLQAASLSFLGLGVNPPTPEWGAVISEAREFLRTSGYLMIFPGLFIILAALSLNLVGDGLRDSLDPRLKT